MASADLIHTLANLIRIGSVNPAYDPESSELEIQKWISSFFSAQGVRSWEQKMMQDRSNVIAILPSRNSTRRIVFEALCDTAGVDGMTIPPFDPQIAKGDLRSRNL